jgi:hypothetical protein
MSMLIDESVLHSGSLAKYRAAFFRISRSSSVRRSRARSLRISLFASINIDACSAVLSGLTALTPFVQAVGGDAQPFRHFGNGIATIDDLANRFVFEFWGISLVAHSTSSYARIIARRCLLDRGKSKTRS